MSSNDRPLVWLLGTGGTIAQWGSSRTTFYDYGTDERLDVFQNLERIPEVNEYIEVRAEHLWQAGSGTIRTPELLALTNKINGIFEDDPAVDGVVVTHGTSSMEETTYWLNLTVKSEKPVVVTGMRLPSAMGTDADNNLFGALLLAGSADARDKGTLLMLNDEIQAAREVTKQNSYRLETFGSRELGMLGYMDSDLTPVFYRQATRKHTHQTEFKISGLNGLPRVDIL